MRGQALAKRLAPQKSGALKKGIRFRLFQNKMELISSVPKSFPYHLWVNRNIPTIRPRQPYFRSGQGKIAYGQSGVVSPIGNAIRWSGTPGYFDLTIKKLERDSEKVFSNHIGKILRARG